jgi:DNA-binding PadR family transcriptional regulator
MREPTYYILAALLDGPMHGYAIIKHAAQASGGRVNLAVGTLAGEGRVAVDREETVEGRTRRYYRLTDLGRQALLAEAARMQQAASVVTRRLATPIAGPA